MCFDSEILSIQTKLKSFISSKIFCPHNAEDVLQEVNTILVCNRNNFNKSKSFSGWAFTITRFQIKKFLTNKKRNREDCVDFSFDSLDFESNSSTPSQKLLNKEKLKSRLDCINFILNNKMSDREKTFFKYTKDGWGRTDIMNEMNLKQTNYYAYRRRINQKFKNHLCEA